MSADKRTVSTDALATLGTIIEDGGRDAIHLAVEPVIAAEDLEPGADIGIIDGKATATTFHYLGIVDPFLKKMVKKGQKFWLIVYPRQITSLRHVWSHPDFPEDLPTVEESKIDKATSIEWLRDWCENTDDAPTYEELIELFTKGEVIGEDREYYGSTIWSIDGEYMFANGHDAHGEIPNAYEVKHHLEIVTGLKILSMPKYFTCSC